MLNPFAGDVISFKDRATADQAKPRNDILVIEPTIQGIKVARVLIDTGCSANIDQAKPRNDILVKSTLERMAIGQHAIIEGPSPVVGLSRDATMALGSINLSVRAGSVTKIVEFLVVDRLTSYNAIVGTPWLYSMRAIPLTFHLCLKFPTPHGIDTIEGDPKVSQVSFRR